MAPKAGFTTARGHSLSEHTGGCRDKVCIALSKMLWDWEGSPSSKYGLSHDVYKMQNWVMPEISYIYHDNFLSSMTLHIINKGRHGGGYVLEKKKTKYFSSCAYVFV